MGKRLPSQGVFRSRILVMAIALASLVLFGVLGYFVRDGPIGDISFIIGLIGLIVTGIYSRKRRNSPQRRALQVAYRGKTINDLLPRMDK